MCRRDGVLQRRVRVRVRSWLGRSVVRVRSHLAGPRLRRSSAGPSPSSTSDTVARPNAEAPATTGATAGSDAKANAATIAGAAGAITAYPPRGDPRPWAELLRRRTFESCRLKNGDATSNVRRSLLWALVTGFIVAMPVDLSEFLALKAMSSVGGR